MRIGLLRKSVFFASLIAIWVLVSKLNIWPQYTFPSPFSVIESLVSGFRSGTYLPAIKVSMLRLGAGYLISLIVGLTLGAMLARIKWLDDTVGSLVLGLQTLPSICWLPLAILWFGYNGREIAIIFVIFMGAVLSISISTKSGVSNVSPVYLKTARTMGVKGIKVYTQVMLPAALPNIVNGMKLGWSFAWRSLMAAELIFATLGGLGNLLQNGRDLNDMNKVIAVMVIIITIGLLVDKLVFSYFERKIEEKWGLKKT